MAFEALRELSTSEDFLIHLKPEAAATGDNFEIAKFLSVFLHEICILHPDLLEEDCNLCTEESLELKVLLKHMQEPETWDTYESWPAFLFQPSNTAITMETSTPTVIFQVLNDIQK